MWKFPFSLPICVRISLFDAVTAGGMQPLPEHCCFPGDWDSRTHSERCRAAMEAGEFLRQPLGMWWGSSSSPSWAAHWVLRHFVPSMGGSVVDAFCSVRTKRDLEGLLEELLAPGQMFIVLAWAELKNERTQMYPGVSGCLGAVLPFVWTLPWLDQSRTELFSLHHSLWAWELLGKT